MLIFATSILHSYFIMYTLIDKTAKKAISTNVKTIICKEMNIDPSTLWRLLGNSTYLEYKQYILVVTKVTKLVRKTKNNMFIEQSKRVKEVMKIISDENIYQKNR